MTATSEGGSSGTDVLIGEVLTYEIEFIVPKGQTYDATLLDTLPQGLRYVAGTASLSRDFTTGLSASQNPGGVNTASAGVAQSLSDGTEFLVDGDTALSLWLGDLINSDSDVGDESYTLSFSVVVANEASVGNNAGVTLTSVGELGYIDGINQNQSLSGSSTPTLKVEEPSISVGGAVSSNWILTAGGTIAYTVTVSNASGVDVATAYDVVVRDSLPFDADEWESLTLHSTSQVGNAGGFTNSSSLGNGQIEVSIDSIAPGASATLVFRATADGAPYLTTETDSMDHTAYVTLSSLPGTRGSGDATPGDAGDVDGERISTGSEADVDYADNTRFELEVLDLALIESVLDAQSHYSIGDTVTFQLEIAVPDGVTVSDGAVEIALPAGVSYLTNSLTNLAGNDYPAAIVTDPSSDFTRDTGDPDTLSLNLGSISNATGSADTIVMTYYGIVDNEIGNQYSVGAGTGTTLEDEIELQFSNPIHPDAAFDDLINDSVSVETGEPYLDFNYQIVSGDSTPGATLNFQVIVTNTGNRPAYEVSLDDAATTYLENITGLTVSSTSGGASGPGSFTNNGNN